MDIVLKYEGVWQVLFSAELFLKSTVIFPEISELTTLATMPPPSSERLNGLALITIHKDIHFKYRDVIDQYVMQQNRRLQFE